MLVVLLLGLVGLDWLVWVGGFGAMLVLHWTVPASEVRLMITLGIVAFCDPGIGAPWHPVRATFRPFVFHMV